MAWSRSKKPCETVRSILAKTSSLDVTNPVVSSIIYVACHIIYMLYKLCNLSNIFSELNFVSFGTRTKTQIRKLHYRVFQIMLLSFQLTWKTTTILLHCTSAFIVTPGLSHFCHPCSKILSPKNSCHQNV